MKDKFLPIGTVVLLKNATRKVMITGYLIYSKSSDKKTVYDYGACVFPEGIIDSNNNLGFNHDQIDKIIHMGLEDEDEKKFISSLHQISDNFHEKFDA